MAKMDRPKFTKIFEKNRTFLDCFLRKRGLSECDREDLIQDTFLRCFPILFEKTEEQHLGLLITTARNLHIDGYRKKIRQPAFTNAKDLDKLTSDTGQSQRLQQRTLVHEWLQSVRNGPDSMFFLMFYDEERGIQEIADLTNTPQGTVASRIHRFRAKFFQKASHSLLQLEALEA